MYIRTWCKKILLYMLIFSIFFYPVIGYEYSRRGVFSVETRRIMYNTQGSFRISWFITFYVLWMKTTSQFIRINISHETMQYANKQQHVKQYMFLLMYHWIYWEINADWSTNLTFDLPYVRLFISTFDVKRKPHTRKAKAEKITIYEIVGNRSSLCDTEHPVNISVLVDRLAYSYRLTYDFLSFVPHGHATLPVCPIPQSYVVLGNNKRIAFKNTFHWLI